MINKYSDFYNFFLKYWKFYVISGQQVDKIDIFPDSREKTCWSRESGIFENEKNSIPGKGQSMWNDQI